MTTEAERLATRARRMARVLEGNETVPTLRVIGFLQEVLEHLALRPGVTASDDQLTDRWNELCRSDRQVFWHDMMRTMILEFGGLAAAAPSQIAAPGQAQPVAWMNLESEELWWTTPGMPNNGIPEGGTALYAAPVPAPVQKPWPWPEDAPSVPASQPDTKSDHATCAGPSEINKTALHHASVAERLRAAADDPMWADHAEVSKATLKRAAQLLMEGPDVQAAARYGWLRQHWNDDYVIGHERRPEELDAFVDFALITGRIAP